MLQKTLKIIFSVISVFKFNKAASVTIIADFFIYDLISPAPDLENSSFPFKKSSAITIIATISVNSCFCFYINHKHLSCLSVNDVMFDYF